MMIRVLTLLLLALLLGGCNMSLEKAGIEVLSEPNSKIFIDGKEAGYTPYKNNSLIPGEVLIKLQTDKGEIWEKKVRLQNRTSTIVSREFKDNGENGGFILGIEPIGDKKKSPLIVNSSPDRATVMVDGETKGLTPMKWEDVGEGDRQITISYPAAQSVNIFAKGILGYQLIINADLPEEMYANNEMSPTPTPKSELGKLVSIKNTETGWLRVRSEANKDAPEIGRVLPGETYPVFNEANDYFQIELKDKSKGWISTKYAEQI